MVRRLVERGDQVTSFSRRFYPELEHLGVRQAIGDLADENAVDQACRDMDLVFHVAGRTGVWGAFETYYKTNVTGTLNILSACRRQHVPRLIYTSSPSVVFDGHDMEGADESVPYPSRFTAHYPHTKALAEQAVRKTADAGLKTIILRPHLIWGPRDNALVPRIIARAKRLVKVGDGNNRVDTVYIDNAADAHILAADRLKENPQLSGNVYFITQDDPIPLWDMVNAILAAAGLTPVKRSISKKTAWFIGLLMEGAYKTLRLSAEPPLTRFVAEELGSSHWFNINAAKKDLGYKPMVSTAEGLQRLAEWLRKEKEAC